MAERCPVCVFLADAAPAVLLGRTPEEQWRMVFLCGFIAGDLRAMDGRPRCAQCTFYESVLRGGPPVVAVRAV